MRLSELYWYRITPLHFLLWPLSILYNGFLWIKRLCYWLDIFPTVKLPVPLIVVESYSINDDNKIPLLIWLIDWLLVHGYTPGIIICENSSNAGLPHAITADSRLSGVSGKTFLLAQHCNELCPIWMGSDRAAVAQALLNAHPTCNIIICADGLSDYRLEHDIELVIIDFGIQSYGNGLLLPAGPLRIGLHQLNKTSIIVTTGKPSHQHRIDERKKTYNMKLMNEMAYHVSNPTLQRPLKDFSGKKLHAITNDSNTHWFFDLIHQEGLNAELHDYRDNHLFDPHEIEFSDADAILMPEENALSCKDFAHNKLWAIPRKVWVNDELQVILLHRIQKLTA